VHENQRGREETRVGRDRAVAFAPATVGNVGVGFDLLGHAVTSIGDTVRVRKIPDPDVRVTSFGVRDLPTDPTRNTATAGLLRLRSDLDLPFGFEVEVRKGIPLGSGMGGSAASAAAAIVAANALLETPLSSDRLLAYGMHGEAAATGSYHADNLAPAVLGGLVLVRRSNPPDAVRIPVPEALRCVLVHPALRVETREARAVLPESIPLALHVAQSGNLAAVIAGCYAGDLELIGRGLADLTVEPYRAPLVRGFEGVKRAALAAGALGCSLSGSGPSVFAWCDGEEHAITVRAAMLAAFSTSGVSARGWVSRVDAPGARLVDDGWMTSPPGAPGSRAEHR
jgi:homoserine kinase